MKFSLKSWNPFAWVKTKPLTQEQILAYDIEQKILKTNEKLHKLDLERIELQHQQMGHREQLQYLGVEAGVGVGAAMVGFKQKQPESALKILLRKLENV